MSKISSIKYQVLSMLIVGLMAAMPVQAFSLRGVGVKVRQKYIKRKVRYVKTRNTYKNMRLDYLKVKKDLKKYRSGNLKNLSLEQTKEYFMEVDQGMIKYLELIQKKVEKAEGLDATQKSSLIAEIDKDITWLESKQEEVQKAENKEELRSLAKEVRDYWKEVRKRVRGIIGRLMSYRVGHVIERMEAVGDKVKKVIDRLAEKGRDVSELERWYEQYEEHLAKAKEIYQTAKTQYGQVENVAEGDKFLRAGNGYMREVNVQLREAYKALKKIVIEMKKM